MLKPEKDAWGPEEEGTAPQDSLVKVTVLKHRHAEMLRENYKIIEYSCTHKPFHHTNRDPV